MLNQTKSKKRKSRVVRMNDVRNLTCPLKGFKLYLNETVYVILIKNHERSGENRNADVSNEIFPPSRFDIKLLLQIHYTVLIADRYILQLELR